MRYSVYVNYSVSQIIDVDADSVDEAIDQAYEEVDLPNIGNRFEPDSDPHVVNVHDAMGNLVWSDE